jgi:ABC-2 type transport system ATP-binding protein
MPLISIQDLSHAYGDRRALADVSLQIEAGEIFGFLGPNGSGKTTLFRVLSTLIPPQSGQVTVSGLDLLKNRDEIRKRIAVVFQYPSLDKQLTAPENLRHHGHLYGLRGAELESRITQMLSRFNLNDRRSEYTQAFSGGMRRRVELAKGLLTRPEIFLMDEPSTGLDPTARIEMWQALAKAREEDHVTILVTTHLMEEAERCDRLAIMDQGKIVALGTPAELKERIGGDIITLTSHDLPALKTALGEKFQITPEQLDNRLRIERPRAHEFIPQLVEALPGLIDSLSIGKPTLEDVFIHTTGHRLSDETP